MNMYKIKPGEVLVGSSSLYKSGKKIEKTEYLIQNMAQNKIISFELEEKMNAMVGFRNIAVHEYQNIDKEILKSILQNNLRDIEEFYKSILLKFE